MTEEIVVNKKINDEMLNSITDFQSAIEILDIDSIDFLEWDTSKYRIIEDKNKLIGKKFLAIQWKFKESKEYVGREFVIVNILTNDPVDGHNHYIITDGSAGICQQLRQLTERREETGHPNPQSGALINGGLVLSEYERFDEKGTLLGVGKTFYLSN